ncbi:hypothetical protein BU23DRAFT_553838 [Bimuria novae-zelandiae CBS 107.79]|uniref:F-box domain-containing protein n=1 Tax=Bimuria novae-zelandiae CBS 107.79 TaxID=1447943 RepID=A0A6A5VCY6_9PLEO|nr:hypothetical protein BU23DRAFT_553838 [Bimuria novae-zelandiae CBS 107.79]
MSLDASSSRKFPGSYFLLCNEVDAFQCPTPSNAGLLQMFSKEPPSWIGSAPWLWTTVARPVKDVHFSQSYLPKRSNTLSPLEKLPNELLDQILAHLREDAHDVIAWGLSSNAIWSYVLRIIHSEQKQFAGMWTGKEVGFYEYTPTSDEGVFQCRSVWDRRPAVTNAPDFLERYNVDERQLSDVVKTSTQRWTEVFHTVRFFSRSAAVRWKGLSEAQWNDIEHDLFFHEHPQDRIWLLRNLTTSEFVRSDKLQPSARKSSEKTRPKLPSRSSTFARMLKPFASKSSPGKAPASLQAHGEPFDASPLTFAQIFLVLTCHSDQPSHHEVIFDFHDGRWRGHCFDMVPLDVHRLETKEADWADVSDLAVDDVANLRYWVQQLNGDGNCCPKSLRPHVEADRNMYHNWEGLETPLLVNRPEGKWMLKKPMETGILKKVQ